MTPPVISCSMVGHSALLPLAPYSSFTFFFWGGFCFWFFYFGDSWENQTIGVKDSVPPHSSIYKTFFSCFLLAHPSDFNGQQQQQQQWLCPLRTTRQHIFLWFFFFFEKQLITLVNFLCFTRPTTPEILHSLWMTRGRFLLRPSLNNHFLHWLYST